MNDAYYLYRKIDSYLLNWRKEENRMPLIIKGARQIGKTESIKHFASSTESNYESFININFSEDLNYRRIIADGYRTDDIIKNISLIDNNIKFIPGKTLILFDEVQAFPEIATSLKFFKEDKRFDVIASGSLLGINYERIESNSVGNKLDYEMTSFDFEEYLWALGYSDDQINNILSKMLTLTPFNENEMYIYKKLFIEYTIVGGMPNILKEYLKNKTFENTINYQHQIINDYKADIKKYASGIDKARILDVFNSIPNQLSKENKKFKLSQIENRSPSYDYNGCVTWLNEAGVINQCHCLNFPELPLGGNIISNKYKVYMADTGLLISILDDEVQDDLRANKNLGVYKGAIYENMIAESFTKQGYRLYYYKRDNSTLEEDFFLRNKDFLIPIEVKANSNKSKSLNELISNNKYSDIKFGFKLSKNNIGYSNHIYTFPYFCSFLMKRFLKEFIPFEKK